MAPTQDETPLKPEAQQTTNSPPHEQHQQEQQDPQNKQKPQQEQQPTAEEWEIQRDHHKSLADQAFRDSNYPTAISNYTLALSFDPSHHILHSNRSAAYLSNGEKSRALADAKRCVELKPDFVKGHSRVASAMASLGRWNEARKVYGHILGKLDGKNEMAKRGLDDCRVREERVREERERELARLVRVREEGETKGNVEAKIKVNVETKTNDAADEAAEGGDDDEDDLLNDFFDDVEEATTKKASEPPTATQTTDETTGPNEDANSENKIKIQLSDLGNTETQMNRLLCSNHEWYNLNPFRVLDLSHRAPTELVSRRYKALSLLLHPDKVRNAFGGDDEEREKAADRAATTFEFVRKAMESLQDEDKARHVRGLVDQGYRQGKKDYESACSARCSTGNNNCSSKSMDKTQKEELRMLQEKATMKIFAEIEYKRRDVEKRKRSHEMRERSQEDAEVKKSKNERTFEKKWKEEGRVEKRIGNWRDFQKVGGDHEQKKKKIG